MPHPLGLITAPNHIGIRAPDPAEGPPHQLHLTLPDRFPITTDDWAQVALALTWWAAPEPGLADGVWSLTALPGKDGAHWLTAAYLGDHPDTCQLHLLRRPHALWQAVSAHALLLTSDQAHIDAQDLPPDPSARAQALHAISSIAQPLVEVLNSFVYPIRTDWSADHPRWQPLPQESLAVASVTPDRSLSDWCSYPGPLEIYPEIVHPLRRLATSR